MNWAELLHLDGVQKQHDKTDNKVLQTADMEMKVKKYSTTKNRHYIYICMHQKYLPMQIQCNWIKILGIMMQFLGFFVRFFFSFCAVWDILATFISKNLPSLWQCGREHLHSESYGLTLTCVNQLWAMEQMTDWWWNYPQKDYSHR